MHLKRYWFEFNNESDDVHDIWFPKKCGVTAYNYEDAIDLLRLCVFKKRSLPQIKKVVEDVDISNLDANHVRLNMSIPTKRGVWYPIGYD